jgi:hypothetical protein
MKKVESDTVAGLFINPEACCDSSSRSLAALPTPLSALKIRLRPFTQTSVYQFIATKDVERGSLSKNVVQDLK